MTATKKLTPAQKRALHWVRGHQPVSMFPVGGPSLSLIKRMDVMGLIERAGCDPGRFGFTRFQLSDAGRAALDGKP